MLFVSTAVVFPYDLLSKEGSEHLLLAETESEEEENKEEKKQDQKEKELEYFEKMLREIEQFARACDDACMRRLASTHERWEVPHIPIFSPPPELLT